MKKTLIETIVTEWMDECKERGNPISVNRAILDVANTYDELSVGDVERMLRFHPEYGKSIRFAPIDVPLSGTEISEELKVKRQNVSQILKRALRKAFYYYKKQDSNMTPFEIACYLATMFRVDTSSLEMRKFFNLFPPDVRELIEESGMEQCRAKDREQIRNEKENIQAMSELLQLQEDEG
jgi:hypothetical protein